MKERPGFQRAAQRRAPGKSAVEKGETKEMTLATAGFVNQDMLTDPFFLFLFLLLGSKL